jgi:eukaryotic-like serine/threonine-protein kinase
VTLKPGARLGPYEIGVLLGRGGMGDVYRAIDTRVGRTVAIKVLPADAAAHSDRRQRFEREARAVARLNHPHICTLYDVGQQDGHEFLVMEYLDGETLGARLARGPLPLAEALKHAAALAQALARAHREGITHRDIKPSNIMLTESGVKLLDFGLAKLRERDSGAPPSPLDDQPTGTALSPEGTLIGTIAYMSPEQLEGRPVDARTDIYALGLIIYEMVTGQRAFAKGSQAGLIAAILTEEPPPMSAAQPKTPPPLERIVLTALAKDPNKRWQDAGDLAREVAWVAADSHTTSVGAAPPSAGRRMPVWVWPAAAAAIVVAAIGTARIVRNGTPIRSPVRNPQSAIRNLVILPCRASGDVTSQAYCDGLTDTLSARMTPLAASRGLQITSTLDVRQRGVVDATAARREFGATLVLEGGVMRAADALRVNYVLIDAATLRQVDSYSSTGAAGDAFALQDRVATWAAGVLALKLNAEERQTLTASGTRTPGALDLYLQGRGYLLDYQKPGNVDAAIDRFNRAIALDPRYALAYAGLGGAFWHKFEASQEPIRVEQARAACAQAVALEPELPASHTCLGTVALGTGAVEEAVEAFRRALDREPTSDEANLGLARAQARSGAVQDAEATYQRAIALRPRYWATHVWLGTFYRGRARYPEAVQQYELALALTPDNARVYYILCGLYGTGSIGRYDDAIAACRKSAAMVPSVAAYSNWGAVLSNLRRFDEAIVQFGEARRVGPEDYVIDGNMARAYDHAGRRADARAMYRRAVALGEETLTIDPRDTDARISVAAFHAKLGDRGRAVEHLNRMPSDLTDPHVLLFGAVVYVDLGERATALTWLERAARGGLVAGELHDWIELDALKGEPRYAALVNK